MYRHISSVIVCEIGTPPWFIEVLNPETNKGVGLQKLAEALHIPLDAVVAFGDGDNDIQFVESAGLGVAMKNARPTLKAVADEVTERAHGNDGVAHKLMELEARGALWLPAPRNVSLRRGGHAVIRRVSADDVVDLRARVLWPGNADRWRLPEDETAIHLGAHHESTIVGVLSLFVESEAGARIGAAPTTVSSSPRKYGEKEASSPSLPRPRRRAQFRKVAVDESFQSLGIGSALISVAEAEAKAAGATSIFCHARDVKVGFYERLGMHVMGDAFAKYHGASDMFVEMEKTL